mmetsp:Transcript_12149/g.29426  ORF Transcript_12149/g.29426 Transcript_12149/m.29426 type:complete len:272 (-) Transcript_12149:660-1475(-)
MPRPTSPLLRVLLLVCVVSCGMQGADSQTMPGGVSKDVHQSNQGAFEAGGRAAVAHLNERSNVVPEYTLGRIVSVRKQVVAGTMMYITYEAVRNGVTRTEVCAAKVWHKLDDTLEVMSNSCTFSVVSVDAATYGGGAGAEQQHDRLQLMGGFKTLDPDSEEARSAAVAYARGALGLDGGGAAVHPAQEHAAAHHAHHAADVPRAKEVLLCAASKQVVNGINYRLMLGLQTGTEMGTGAAGTCTIEGLVHKSFDDVFEVKTPPQDDAPTGGA